MLFTGNGYFNAYLVKMQKVVNPACQYQDFAYDFHNFFEGESWIEDRGELE